MEVQDKCLPIIKKWFSEMKHEFFLELEKLNADFTDLQIENVFLH